MFKGLDMGGFTIDASTQIAILVVFVVYSVMVVGLGFFIKFRQGADKSGKFASFLTGGGGLNAVEVALVAAMTAMGGGTMISGPGLTYRDGFAYAIVNLANFMVVFASLTIFGRRYAIIGHRIKGQTSIQVLHYRYQSKACAAFFAVGVAIALTISAGGQMLSAAKLFTTITGADSYLLGLALTAVIIVLYTITGGVKSLAKISVLQGAFMLVAVIVLGFAQFNQIRAEYGSIQASMEFVARVNTALVDVRTYTPVYLIGMFVSSSFTNITSPAIIQSSMTYNNADVLKKAIPISAGIMLLVQLIMGTSGPFSYALNQQIANADYSTVYLTTSLLPRVMAGIVFAAVFAAIQSSIAAFLLLIAGSITRDLYKDCINKDAGDETLSKVNTVMFIVVSAAAFVIAMNQASLGQEILILSNGFLISVVCVPMLIGTFWKKATSIGAVSSGITALASFMFFTMNSSSEWYQHYFLGAHASVPTLIVEFAVFIIVSLLTQKKKVPLGVFRVLFCKDYDERYTYVYDSSDLRGLED